MERLCKDLRDQAMKIINYALERNDTADKWRKIVLWKTKSLLYMRKTILYW